MSGAPHGSARERRPHYAGCHPSSLNVEVWEHVAKGLQNGCYREFVALTSLCVLSTFGAGLVAHSLWLRSGVSDAWKAGCQQCRQEWWDDFWHWRFLEQDGESPQRPPEGMRWDWSISQNAVDWWDASSTLVDTVLVHHVDPSLGPVLQIGCGESPLPQMLHRAGFLDSEHLDISPQVIMSMRDRHSGPEWQGMKFHVRDFMRESTGGPPLPAHRFAAVIDKAGIWDWLQDEAPWALPRLLANVLAALVKPPQVGVYVVVTKQTPREFQRSLALAPIVFVESSRSLNELAWAYVLVPH